MDLYTYYANALVITLGVSSGLLALLITLLILGTLFNYLSKKLK